MDNSSLDEIVVLRVKNICCTAYQKQLKKELSKITGVYAIAINPEKSVVSVRGKVDANVLLNTIAKTGKYAEIMSYPTNDESRHHQNAHERQRNDNQHHRNRSPNENYGKRIYEEEEQHKCEDYIPPPIDERICRDFYCKNHNMRPIFPESVPLGYFPYRAALHTQPSYGFGPRWFGGPPAAPVYGYHSRRPMRGRDSYGFYGHGTGRGWTFM